MGRGEVPEGPSMGNMRQLCFHSRIRQQGCGMIPAEAVEAAPSSVPLEYCDGGVCVRMAERWEWAERYSQWLAVCNEHGDRILASQVQK